ncbi:MAG: hypothetical protein OEZ32_05270 [Nitrospinota bacterium]|nr:hypothetical protein [Nitrospinota bacterium]
MVSLSGILSLFAIVFYLENAARKRTVPALEHFAKKNDGTIIYNWNGIILSGAMEEEKFLLIHSPRRRKYFLIPQPPSIALSITHQANGLFAIASKSTPPGPGSPLGAAPLVKTGNALFDKEFLIYSPHSAFIATNFKDGEKRQAIRRIFTLGAKWLNFDGFSLSAVWEPFEPDTEIDENMIKETLARLTVLVKHMQPALDPNPDTGSKLYAFIFAILAVFLATVVLPVALLYLM